MDAQQRIIRLEEDLSVLKKRHEENLEKLEILNRHFALANDIMYIYDTNFNVLSVSPNVEKLLGYKPEEIIGRPFHELGVVDELDLEKAAKDAVHVLLGGTIDASVYRFVTKDGRRRFGEASGIPLVKEGRIVGVFSVARDITERIEMERAFREEAEKYLVHFSLANDVLYAVDPELRITSVSPSVKNALGYEPEELIGRHLPDLEVIHPEDIGRAASDTVHMLAGEKVDSSVYRFLSRNGAVRYGEVKGITIRKEGRVAGVVSLARDVTRRIQSQEELAKYRDKLEELVRQRTEELIQANESLQQEIEVRRRTEEELRSSEEKYRLLVENANEGIFVAQEGVLKFVNPMISKISGYTQEELKARPFDHLIHPDDRDAVLDRHRRRMEGEALPEVYRFRVLNKSGGIRWIEVNAVPIPWEGRVAALTFLADITERKRAEQAIQDSEAILRGLAENLPGAVYQFYAHDNGEMGLHYVSERTLDLLGLDSRPDDFFERFTACVEPEDREGFLSSIRTAVNAESKWEHEVRFKTPSGEDRYVRGMSRPRRVGSELVFDGVLLDVTDRRKVEEELLRHRERLEEMVMARTSELTDTLGKLTQEIEVRKRTEATLRFREMELQNRGSELEEMNAALKVLLRQREEDKASTEMNIIANMKTFILPYIEKLEAMGLEENRMRTVSMIKSHLNEITSPFTRRISSEYLGFTPAEIQVASMIRDGKCSKEIAKLLNISLNTVHTYRFNIRRKAGLKNNKVNLRSYLQTLE
jgi:PAS domain S-box-containing protein